MLNSGNTKTQKAEIATNNNKGSISPPAISLPKGGGAIRGMGEKFAANPVTGTGAMAVPIATSPGRGGFGPQLSLSYDSGSGNGPFGFGWSLSLPCITRKTDKGLPQYHDGEDSDVFILSGAEDLVPVLVEIGGHWQQEAIPARTVDGVKYYIQRYRPRVEGLFARIERWTRDSDGNVHWRSITSDNVTTLYGKDNNSRIFDPADPHPTHPTRIFSWLICESYDDKGNHIVYKYKEEDALGVDLAQAHEKNRTDSSRSANRYLKRIYYGNKVSRLAPSAPPDPVRPDWMFELVFDYGEGHYAEELPDDEGRVFAQAFTESPAGSKWPTRPDPFSSYRAGFEIRTYRLCQHVLNFHHFAAELGMNDYLVRSTDFSYDSNPTASFITSVIQSGYRLESGQYLKKSLPPLEFSYSQIPTAEQLARQPIRLIDAQSLENLPQGLDNAAYQWVDLDGEGLSGILTEQANGWFYKRNLSANNLVRENGSERAVAKFGTTEVVASKPVTGLAGGAQFLDLAGDGQVDLVQMEGPVRGFYERTTDADWKPFRSFESWPNLNTGDPDLKFVDLTGDGHADILITEGEALIWHPSLAEDGFGPNVRVSLPLDEEKGPRLVFADGTQSIYLADLSGDGLSDLVRIRNGEVCYWPNLGYGRFGAKVTMDNAPWFDAVDQFDQRRIRLADTDGSGTTDILYLHGEGVRIYFNQSGNRWSDPAALPQFPPIDNIASIQTMDLLGNGTACLVWSSPLPGNARRPMRYIALMEEKPHLMIGVKNNLGAETKVHYAPSTKFYLNDKQDGKPWVTRLPFPVHVVERVETYDYISRNRFVTRYAYHHGYFDGEEREFRGFGMVEQWDTEKFAALSASDNFPTGDNVDAASHVPPVHTRTWFHTGAFFDRDHISNFFAGLLDEHDLGEYYREPGLNDTQARALFLADTVLPDGLSAEEEREACRALKGSMLRQEVYTQDDTDKAQYPYAVTEQNFTVERLQPRAGNRHAVFFTHAREAISYHYERNPDDPRVTHALTLEVDDFGNVLRSLAIGYPRADVPARQPEQNETHLTLTLNRFANFDDQADWRRVGLPVETRTYEVVKPPTATQRFTYKELSDLVTALVPLDQDEALLANTIPYEQYDWRKLWDSQTEPGGLVDAVPVNTRLRLIEHVRTLYRKNDLTSLLPLGSAQSLALPGESYKLAFTPALVRQILVDSGKLTAAALNGVLSDEGKYVHSLGDAVNWWIPSGRIFYSPDPAHNPIQELTVARAHFFLPHRYRDPFHTSAVTTESFVTYDAYDLLMLEGRDPLGNRVTVGERLSNDTIDATKPGNDYRVLQPWRVMDPNRNRTQVAFDVLGMVVGTAVMGKPEENPVPGDRLEATFRTDPTRAEIDQFIANPMGARTATLLDKATTRIIYDLDRFRRSRAANPDDPTQWLPPFAATLARETHVSDLQASQQTKIQISFNYSDGFGREIQKKIQAEPGEVEIEDAAGNTTVVDTTPTLRWVGSGWTIFNNKGKPVRQYEPFFSTHHQFQFGKKVGVSPILFYDPVERVVATLHPNHTYEKVVFDPWQQTTWDVNDTVKLDPRTDTNISGYVTEYFKQVAPQPDDWETWLQQRGVDPLAPPPDTPSLAPEKKAAVRTLPHADTPTIAYFDTLGRPFLTIAHNKYERNGAVIEEKSATRVELDIENNQRSVTDALGRKVMTYDYDMLGAKIHQSSMDAGERWMLNDVAGKPILGWDSLNFMRRMTYDKLRRPTGLYVTENGAERLAERTVYGESQGHAANLRTRVYQIFDSAGIVTSPAYDFKGNLLEGRRDLLPTYKQAVDWLLNPNANDGRFTSHTTFDALNRPLTATSPDSSVYRPTFNEANLLNNVDVNLRAEKKPNSELKWTPFVTNIDYNAKGQRTRIEYNQASHPILTEYTYDKATFRLTGLVTTRPLHPEPNKRRLQDLSYTYDPVGNITHILDQTQPRVFFDNDCIDASNDYRYDALYRLMAATGREHKGQDLQPGWDDSPRMGNPIPYNCTENRQYVETYRYDAVGNILQMIHHLGNNLELPGAVIWNRRYQYRPDNNQLRCTSTPGEAALPEYSVRAAQYGEQYTYDAHGNMTTMSHLTLMQWDYRDQLQATSQQDVHIGGVPETTYYVYDASGQRVRKVTERQNGTRKAERIYLGGYEIFREYNGGTGAIDLKCETLHIIDDKQRIALVETRTDTVVPEQLIRYQFSNHLGTACLETDDTGEVISYEEFHPYGTTSYQAVNKNIKAAAKRYRYTGKERDEENGLYYHGARYYAPWLGRWTSCDPAGLVDGHNLYHYVMNNPIRLRDPSGLQSGDDDITFTATGPMRRVEMAPHVDEATAVKGNLAGGVAGSPSDLANKQFLDPRTNSQTKSNFVSNTPINPRPNVSAVSSPQEAGNRLLTGRLSEVDEMQALADDATARTKPGERTNPILRENMKNNQAIRNANASIGVNPDTLKAENPPGVQQFPKTGTVNLSPKDADLDPTTGRVTAGPNTTAAQTRRGVSASAESAAEKIASVEGNVVKTTLKSQVISGAKSVGKGLLGVGIGVAANWVADKIRFPSDIPLSEEEKEKVASMSSGLPPGINIALAAYNRVFLVPAAEKVTETIYNSNDPIAQMLRWNPAGY